MSVPAKCEVVTSSYTWHIKNFSENVFTFYEPSRNKGLILGVFGFCSDRFVLSFRENDGLIKEESVFLWLTRDARKDKNGEIKPVSESLKLALSDCSVMPPNYGAFQQTRANNVCFAWISGRQSQQWKSKLNAGFFIHGEKRYKLFCNQEFVQCSNVFDESKGLVCYDELSVECEVHALTNNVSYVSNWLFKPLGPVVVQKSEHRCSIISDLKQICESGQNSDVTLVAADGKEFPAHIAILSSRSQVFATMFTSNMAEKQLKRVIMKDISSKAVEGLLKFMYTDDISSDIITTVKELLMAADKYRISRLLVLCEEAMVAKMNKDNAAEFFLLADKHHASQLRKAAKRFTATHLKEVKPKNGWIQWMKENQQLAAEILDEMAELVAELTPK